MEIIKIVITAIIVIVTGGSFLAIKKTKNKKTNIKNVTIIGSGKVIGGDDNSTKNQKDNVNPYQE